MIRHIIIAAWRNMAANWLLSALAILGLSLGVTATLVAALLVEGILDFNHFIPGYQNVVMVGMPDARSGHGYTNEVDPRAARLLALALPEVKVAARLVNGNGRFRQGEVAAAENFYWADPAYFQAMPFPVLHGNLGTALAKPDSVVITPETARKYFGRDDVVGQMLQRDGRPLTVTAIVAPLPPQTWYRADPIFVSALSTGSPLAAGSTNIVTETYLRLTAQTDLQDIKRQAHAAVAPLLMARPSDSRDAYADAPLLVPIDRAALRLDASATAELAVAGAVATLLLFLSSVNCVSLMVARTGRRITEVTMRKACGAGRGTLILQFLSEAILTVLLAVILALALTEWIMGLHALGQAAPLDLWHDPLQAPVLAVYVVMLGGAVGAWPVFVLSSFRPAQLSRDIGGARTGPARKALVIVQFAAVIAMLIAALVIDSQRRYAQTRSLGADTANVLMVPAGCRVAFLAEIRKLPGVARASCSGSRFPNYGDTLSLQFRGRQLHLSQVRAGGDTLAVYGVKPLAGVPLAPAVGGQAPPVMAINRAASLQLGFAAPEAAIGTIPFASGPLAGKRVVTVVPDFALYVPETQIPPTVFVPDTAERDTVHVKLRHSQDATTLAAIDRAWRDTGGTGPDERVFVRDHHDVNLEMNAIMLAACGLLAVFLACLGLTGLTVAASERRTKEIGVRKAMGADVSQIVALLLWQFAQPVLWANVIAWPTAWWLMRRWLSGFAYHVDLHWWVFAGASLVALTVALLTVAGQAFLTARQKPVLALRTE